MTEEEKRLVHVIAQSSFMIIGFIISLLAIVMKRMNEDSIQNGSPILGSDLKIQNNFNKYTTSLLILGVLLLSVSFTETFICNTCDSKKTSVIDLTSYYTLYMLLITLFGGLGVYWSSNLISIINTYATDKDNQSVKICKDFSIAILVVSILAVLFGGYQGIVSPIYRRVKTESTPTRGASSSTSPLSSFKF